MSVLAWIFASGLAMTGIAAIGIVTLALKDETVKRLILPLVALSAGSLLGGAFFHMIPGALRVHAEHLHIFIWVAAGFTAFFALEQFLHWHHCRLEEADCRKPVTYMLLIGDSIHNFIGGLAVAGAFLIDIRLGISTFLAAAAHEIPQELGNYAVLIHGGWGRWKALLFNMLAGLTFLIGGLLAYALASEIDTSLIVAFAAGNFIYIGASDLVPEVNKHRDIRTNVVHFASFGVGLLLLLAIRIAFGH